MRCFGIADNMLLVQAGPDCYQHVWWKVGQKILRGLLNDDGSTAPRWSWVGRSGYKGRAGSVCWLRPEEMERPDDVGLLVRR